MMMIPVILGPTASGKTAYAIALAKQIGGAVISADSRQVYAGMNIGTAKPKEAWKSTVHAIEEADIIDGVPHYMLNIATLDTPYSLSDWLTAVHRLIPIIQQQNLVPIIAGGTMLYIDALVDGYSLPNIAPNELLRSELERLPAKELYAKLIAQDPDATAFIEAHNTRRIIRALEVMDATGKKFSELRAKKSSEHEFQITGIFDSYDVLRERITTRAQQMVADGLAEEIKAIQNKFLPAGRQVPIPLLQTMNYKENCDIDSMIQSNMRYAHRQMSWWKRRTDISWICA